MKLTDRGPRLSELPELDSVGLVGRDDRLPRALSRLRPKEGFFYRLTRVDEHCVFVTREGDCTKKLRQRRGLGLAAARG